MAPFSTALLSASPSLPTATPVSPSSKSTDNGPSLATKIGLGAGAGTLLLLILIGTGLILRRRKKHPSRSSSSSIPTDTFKVEAKVLHPRASNSDSKHPFTSSQDATTSEPMQKKEAEWPLTDRRKSQLAQLLGEPGSRPSSQVQEGDDRSCTISSLASGRPASHMTIGHISLIQSEDCISNIAQSRIHLPKIPIGDRLSLIQPSNRSSVSDIPASRQAALDTLNRPKSSNEMGFTLYPMESRSGYTPSLPEKSPRRYSVRSRELNARSIDPKHPDESNRRTRTPLTPAIPPRSPTRSQAIHFHIGSSLSSS
ncbi:hypothetical protein E6O75_ATG08927 [Venturia nashicola]|uniref:Uncharacterized protein n=1 Tax=Venturia nashicola TaxID=86259 RepID=A0A4Z1NXE6_9PEZI|nr:hypothetical protein E6O75_ATG08927 [Venturia nashicola]